MEMNEPYINTNRNLETFHGSYISGQLHSNHSDDDWWQNWQVTNKSNLFGVLSAINVVYVDSEFAASGIFTVQYFKSENTFTAVVPHAPLFFGVRLALVYFEDVIFYKIDPDCFVELPPFLFSWLAGVSAFCHNVTVADLHTDQGLWADVRCWMQETKQRDIGQGLSVWSIFSDVYTQKVQQDVLTSSCAYHAAVTVTKEQLNVLETACVLGRFTDLISLAGTNLDELIKTLSYEDTQQNYKPSDYMRYVGAVQRIKRFFREFAQNTSSLEKEQEVLLAALQTQELLDGHLSELENEVNNHLVTYPEYKAVLLLVIGLLKDEKRHSDLNLLLHSIHSLNSVPCIYPITYDLDGVRDAALRKKLDRFSKDKGKPSDEDRKNVEKAKAFLREENILGWKIKDFVQVAQHHLKAFAVEFEVLTRDADIRDRVTRQLESEQNHMFYRRSLGTGPLTRHKVSIDEYVQSLCVLSVQDNNVSAGKLLADEMNHTFSVLTYWNLNETCIGVNNRMTELSQLAVHLGRNTLLIHEAAWLEALPASFKFDPQNTPCFRALQEVEEYVKAYKTFRKPPDKLWPYTTSELSITSLNKVIADLVGTKVKEMWDKNVLKPMEKRCWDGG